ncbi:phospholipid-translocating ATPase [Blastomyces dermatitidis ATCC 18188]|uniref:Phospholipid-transporting ATPase n=1 Tax=Ajellomyces dermatitidis (strain ATCC 18188 / CBS 674.68) TaxID=653446 RepID=F2TQJ1_AJEDA|nr:phospholipid-translocating ATPase [Blastomyces dermatitidis ATCC 18188]
MERMHEYTRPSAQDMSDDAESDDDLNLNELDPEASVSLYNGQSPKSRGGIGIAPTYGPGIALRHLRAGARDRIWNRSASRTRRQDGEEDTGGLLDDRDGGNQELSGRSSTYADDDMPLLNGPSQPRLNPTPHRSIYSRLSSRLRFPRFGSSSLLDNTPDGYNDLPLHSNADHRPTRKLLVGQTQQTRYPPNVVSNAKYTPLSFLPRTLYNEFSFFFNIYFLLVALSQIIPILRIGYMSSYIAPLAFVVSISLGKEALDDIARRRRDAEANAEEYTVISFTPSSSRKPVVRNRRATSDSGSHLHGTEIFEITKKARDLRVGDILKLRKDQRLPADVVILKSALPEVAAAQNTSLPGELIDRNNNTAAESTDDCHVTPRADESADGIDGSSDTFIRTDQLDGETDWKLRLPSPLTQNLPLSDLQRIRIIAGEPEKNVHNFVGTIELTPPSPNSPNSYDPHINKTDPAARSPTRPSSSDDHHQSLSEPQSAPLTIDNTAWASTVLASNTTTIAAIIYTGAQTRSAMSTSPSRSKVGLLEYEINSLTKILCILTLSLSIILVALQGFEPSNDKPWYIAIMIYLILFSTIIPMSLRVNLDMAKSVYGRFIERDTGIPGTVVRTSTIPEDLGRIEYLLSDKTGTLTQNEMELKKIHVGTVSYANEAMDEVASYLRQGFSTATSSHEPHSSLVTPTTINGAQTGLASTTRTRREIGSRVRDIILALALCHNVTPTADEQNGEKMTTYQASSPDEIAIVKYTQEVGLQLVHRDRQKIVLKSVDTGNIVVRVRILDIFPFTSESKRMGIIVQFKKGSDLDKSAAQDEEIWFYQKGADTVMSSIVATNDWLDEETANMAREGLRTLVIGRKRLSQAQYQDFSTSYKQASLSLHNRDTGMAKVCQEYLEQNLELLGVTGVEDKLQKDVKPSLELLRNAGVKIWMLTGDKVETARCVAVSAKLVARGQYIHTVTKLKDKGSAQDTLDFLRNKTDSCLLIDGESLTLMLAKFRTPFISVAVLLPAVIACRCSPTQKAEIASLIREHTKKRICCIGDGGNDVSMIQAADVGIGIVGKEGRQASLAADFSITQFHHLTKLLVWHGRNSYKRSAKLAQFIMHRGLIISACQTMYSIAGRFDPKGLFINWLLVGYATVYTNAPVFSLVLDRDVDEELANLYPELYKELKTGRSLSYRSFFTWVLVSVYQGSIIQGLSQILVGEVAGPKLISVSFTALVLNELVMVAVSITTWHPVMILCIVGTAIVYAASVPFLGDYFDLKYVVTLAWVWRVIVVAAIALVPVWAVKLISRTWSPPSYRKVRG